MSVTGSRSAAPGAPDFVTALARVEGVEGWLTDAQARRLWDAAVALRPPARIVEIGSFRGRSTIVLASASAEGIEMLAIDPHGGGDRGPQEITPDAQQGEADFNALHANLRRAGVSDQVRHVRAMSQAALDEVTGEIDVLYIDGAHRYGPARADIERWGARVAPGGSMLIHDSFNAIGVTLAQLRLLVLSTRWRYRGRSGSLAEYRREQLGPGAVAASALAQIAGLAYFARNLLIKVAMVARLRSAARVLGLSESDAWPY